MNATSPCASHFFLRLFKGQFLKIPFAMAMLGLILIVSQTAFAATFTVTNTSDSGTGSLRDAITQVNTGSGGDTINFSGVTGTITLGSTLPLNKSVTINGPGANLLTLSGNDTVGVISTGAGTTVNISGLTIAHGFAPLGAGIVNGSSGLLTVTNCVFSNNVAINTGTATLGAAIYSIEGASVLTVNNSTFVHNSASGEANTGGGAIFVSTGVVNNSTFFGNSAPANGSSIFGVLGPLLTVRNSTFVGNIGSGATINASGTFKVSNSIIAGNTGGNCEGTNCTTGDNLIGSSMPPLGPLQYNGGPTPTMLPLSSGTGIIGAGLNSTLATDQRGFARPTSGASDLGAVQTYNLIVTTTDDSTNSGTTCTGGDTCSLRDAITLTDSHGSGDVIPLSTLQGTVALSSALPDITADVNLTGPGANLLTVSGNGAVPVFNITSGVTANLSGLAIANGSSSSNGGGINNSGASLTLTNCALSNNATTGGASGGGLANTNPAGSATVTDCTFFGNNALNGGGIYNLGALLVTNSTFSGNNAPGTAGSGSGGGIFNQGVAVVTSSTVSGNAAGTGGGISTSTGTMTVTNSLVAGNTEVVSPGDDCSSCGPQTPFNSISTAGAPITAAQVMLGPLAYNGLNQTVQTLLPLPGSPAIETGDPTQLPVDLTTDERQLPRTINSKLDLGAVQTNYTAIQFAQQPSNTTVNTSISPAVTMSVTESGTTAVNIPIPITFTGSGALHGTLTQSTVAPTVISNPALAGFADLSGDTVGTGDTLTATLAITPAGITPAQTLTATSNPFNITQATADVPTVTVGPSSPTYGQPEAVTVTVPTTGSVPPTGVVTVYNNGNPIETGTLGPNGTVIVTIQGGTLPAGPASITVGYPGDGNYGSSTSVSVPVTVATVTSAPTLTVGPSSPTVGQPATVTVAVPTVESTPATGTVNIYDNGSQIGTGTLGPNGTVTVNISAGLPLGSDTITAGYPGAGNYGNAISAPVSVTVSPIAGIPTVTVGPSSPIVGQPVTVTVTVPTVGSTPPVGTVIIYDNGNQIGTGTLGPNGTVTVNIPGGLPAGNNNITALYSGGGGIYGSATSATAPVTVSAAVALDFTLTRTSAASQTIIPGQAVTIALQVAPTSGTYPGVVSFTATGLPAGATATFTPAPVAANAGPAPVNLDVQTAPLASANRLGNPVAPIAFGMFLLPLLGAKRKKLISNGRAAGRYLLMVLVLLAGAVTMAGLTGCGSGNGFFGHAPQTYNITITATSGTVQHSVNATLNVQ
jgi:hypothetical protein